MAKQTINNGDSGLAVRTALNENFTELYDRAVADYAAAQALTGLSDGDQVSIAVEGRGGLFIYRTGDFTAEVTADTLHGIYLPLSSDATGASGALVRQSTTVDISFCGADKTGVVDSTDEINAASTLAEFLGYELVGTGEFLISGKVAIKSNTDFTHATFNVSGSPTIAVEISTGNAADPTTEILRKRIFAPKIINVDKPGTGWIGQGIGLRVVSAVSCAIHIPHVQGFSDGLVLTSNNTNGSAYNELHLGHLDNNKRNVVLQSLETNSWVNENNFYGGRMSHNSAEGVDVIGTRHISLLQTGTSEPNNNVFHKPSIEGDTPEYHFESAGSNNMIISGRWEAATPKVQYLNTGASGEEGSNNVIFYGYGAQSIVVTRDAGCVHNMIYDRNNISGESSLLLANTSSSSSPIISGYEAGTDPRSAGANDWSLQLSSQFLKGKQKASAFEKAKVDFVNGRFYVGNGTASPTPYIGSFGASSAVLAGNFYNPDPVTAPGNVSGYSIAYIDPTDGDYRIVYSDGTIRQLTQTEMALTYGTSVAVTANRARTFKVTPTDGVAFTILNPTGGVVGKIITIRVHNTTGGALGAVTWDTAYKLAAWTNPATGFSRSISFEFDGSAWIECGRTTTDVPN